MSWSAWIYNLLLWNDQYFGDKRERHSEMYSITMKLRLRVQPEMLSSIVSWLYHDRIHSFTTHSLCLLGVEVRVFVFVALLINCYSPIQYNTIQYKVIQQIISPELIDDLKMNFIMLYGAASPSLCLLALMINFIDGGAINSICLEKCCFFLENIQEKKEEIKEFPFLTCFTFFLVFLSSSTSHGGSHLLIILISL